MKESFISSYFAFASPDYFLTRKLVVKVGAITLIIISGISGGVEDAVEMLATIRARDLAN